MSNNIFLQDESFYQRDLNPVQQYIEQSAFYISKTKHISFDVAKTQIQELIKNKKFPDMRDPTVQFFERHNYEDRQVTYLPLSQFLRTIDTENLTMAPSMTCYVNAQEKESILSGFTDENVKLRNVAKKEAAKFKALNEMDKLHHYNNEQENKKLYNNSLSGAFSSGGSIVRNPSAHSTLTSTTRTMTSIGNASNERLISGNRHYRDPKITMNNIVVLAFTANKEEIRNTILQYGIKVPTVDDVMECIQFSTEFYWRDRLQMVKIRQFVETLTDEERASVVYTGDLYQLRRLNENFIRNFITELSRKVTDQTFEDPINIIKKTDEMYVNYVHQICMSEVKGINKDYSKISVDKQNIVAGTCKNIVNVLDKYQSFIKTFFLTRNLPPSVAYIRDSIRRSVVLSDTDSTMFSCDEWVLWYYNKDLKFTDEAFAVAGSIMFMATQCIAHSLALYSANLNVERKKLFVASMKPEFVFGVFALTSVGKHYYTNVLVKEGAVYKESELELKGVHIKNSAAPKPIMKDVKNMMETILDTVKDGNKISLEDWLVHCANLEREIKRSVLAGEPTYLGRLNIKAAEAYKVPAEQSNYRHYSFWNEIFAPKYGHAPPPTYAAVKFPTVLSNRKKLAEWISTIQDKELGQRLIVYLERTGRKDLNTIYIAQDQIEAYGIPVEIQNAIDIDSLILEHLKSHRLVLESLGFFCKSDQNLMQMGY